VWFYNLDLTGFHPEVMRFGYGFGLAASGATGVLEWTYQWGYQPNDPGRAYRRLGDYYYVYPPAGEETGGPTTGWEAIREGVDDYKYWAFLQNLIAEARRSDNAVRRRLAEEAERDIAARLTRIDFHGSTGRACQGDWTGRKEMGPNGEKVVSGDYKMANGWSFEDYDATRRAIAEWILRLQ
jgi:hypothetical protein